LKGLGNYAKKDEKEKKIKKRLFPTHFDGENFTIIPRNSRGDFIERRERMECKGEEGLHSRKQSKLQYEEKFKVIIAMARQRNT